MKRVVPSYLTVAFLFVFALALTASATSIVGSVNFGSPVANVKAPTLNTAVFVGTPSFTVITPGTGDLVSVLGMSGTALNITSDGPITNFLTFGGFTVDVTNFLGPNVWTKVSLGSGVDFMVLGFEGLIRHSGFDDTTVLGAISAQYSNGYGPNKVVAWSGNINSTVPEPTTFALIGLGMLAIGVINRRRRVK